jgi:drug/metabolite transporter (DMT)-like permease
MNRYLNYLYLLIAIIIWALAPSIVKIVLGKLDPLPFLILRFLVVVIFLFPIYWNIFYKNFYKRKKYTWYDWKNIIIYSLLSQTSLILFFIGLDYTTAVDSIILALSAPLITIAAGHYFFRDKLNLLKEIGIFIATLGTLLVVIEPLLTKQNGDPVDRFWGNMILILFHIVAAFWVVYTKFLFGTNSLVLISLMKKVGLKLHKKKYDVFEVNMLSFFVAFFTLLPFAFWDSQNYFNQVYSLGWVEIAGIIYMGILSSAVAYILYTKAQSQLSVTEVSIFTYISPIFAIPASYLILGEVPNTYSYIGIAIILIGLFIAEKSPK